jgi:hypothetical protein
VMPVAHRGLSHLSDQRLRVAQQDVQHLAVTLEFLLEPRAREHVRGSGALHDGAVRRGFTAHEECDANRAIVSDNRDFRRCAVFEHVQGGR